MSQIDLVSENMTKTVNDIFPISGTDFIEMYVGNSKQAAHFFKTALGFQSYAYAGLETGQKDKESYVIKQGKIVIILSSPLYPKSKIGEELLIHGDGVKSIALTVPDASFAFFETVKRGAEPFMEPMTTRDDFGRVVLSGIKAYGDTVHLFVERKDYSGHFLPRFKKWESNYKPKDKGLKYIDHMVANVGWNEMNTWVNFYANVLGFSQLVSFDDKDISTEYTALMSKVMSNGNGRIKFPINEPAQGKKKSQVEEYLDFYGGPGAQHIAVATNNIIETVSSMQESGVEFLRVPDNYYDHLLDRVGDIDEDLSPLKDLGILVDRDDEGYLLQIFSKPLGPRPTLFLEIIQRKGAKSFGKGNFKALFEAIEREQELRGTL